MKIAILINSLTAGGAERQAVQDANLLSSMGHETILCYGMDGPLKTQLAPQVQRLDLQTRSQLKAFMLFIRTIQRNNIELVLSHMFWANKVATAACFFTRKKNIVFEHGLGLWRRLYHIILVKIIAQKASKIVTSSEASRKIRIGRERVPQKKVIVLHNSFHAPSESRENAIILNNPPQSDFSIGYAGRFNKVKQLHLLLDVALILKNDISDFLFILIGDGKEKPLIEKMVKEKGLADHFYFTGYVTNPMSYMKKMDCFVLPSKHEEFSLALLEASYCGLPSIAFDVGGNKEIITDGVTGWIVEPFNVTKMAEKILWLKTNPDEFDKMKKIAKQRVEALFSQEQRIKKLSELILETTR